MEDTMAVPGEIIQQEAEFDTLQNEIDTCQDEIEAAEKDAEVVGEVREIFEKNEDGISPQAAEMAAVVLESLYNRLGIQRKDIPSLEAFGSTAPRKETTAIAVESIGESLKRAWEAIKKAAILVWSKIKQFLSVIFSSTKMMRTELKRTEDQVNETKTARTQMKETEFEHNGLQTFYAMDNDTLDIDVVHQINGNLVRLFNSFKHIEKLFEDGLVGVSKFVDNISSVEGNTKYEATVKYSNIFSDKITELRKYAFPYNISTGGDEDHQYSPGVLGSGGTTLILEPLFTFKGGAFYKGSESTVYDISYARYTMARPANKTEVLSFSNMEKLISNSKSLLDGVDEMKHANSAIEKMQKEFDKLADKIIKGKSIASGDVDSAADTKLAADSIRITAKMFNDGFGKLVSILPSMSLKNVRANLQYINLSLKQYA